MDKNTSLILVGATLLTYGVYRYYNQNQQCDKPTILLGMAGSNLLTYGLAKIIS